ncbi:TetR/AcrR family transcriptional regulator [Microbacterium sp. MC2]
MSSPARRPQAGPQTADRIRDAAVAAFAAQGFERTTIRTIAAAAGVSAGLVIHHFGSKEDLRAACDDYVFDSLTRKKRENADQAPSLVAAAIFNDDRMRTHADYLVKSLLDPSEQGQRFFDHYIDLTEQLIEDGFAGYVLRRAEDRRAQAAALAMLGLAPMMLEPRIRHALGTRDLPESMARLMPYLSDLYQHGFIEAVPDGQVASGPRATPGSQHDPPAAPAEQKGTPPTTESES